MKWSRYLPLTVVGALLVVGSALVLLLRHALRKPSEVSAVTVKEPVLVTDLEPSANIEVTNPPSISTARPSSRDNLRLTQLQLMKDFLNLTDEQAKKLDPLLQEQQEQLVAFRRDTTLSRPDRVIKLKEIQTVSDAKIKAVLTPEQAEKWRQRGHLLQQPVQSPPPLRPE